MSLGTVLEDGSVNYDDSTNNGDVVKVFSTVINCVRIFVFENTERIIYFKGNTKQKNRVYNEIIRRHNDEFSKEFHIFGTKYVDNWVKFYNFDISMSYAGFYLILKS